MAHRKRGFLAVTGVILVVLATALLVPAVIMSIDNPQERTFTQNEGETVTLSGSVSADLITVSNQNEINVSIVDSVTGDVDNTNLLAEGDSATVTINGYNVTVLNINAVGGSQATIEYTFPLGVGLPDSAMTLFNNMGLILVVSTFIIIVGSLMVVMEVFE